MKTKFFKSTSFKCIVVLLAIMLICGIFLTICNSLFLVTDKERFDRALQKIYGEPVETSAVTITANDVTNIGDAEILEAYVVTNDNNNYLIKSKGNGGFDGGSVTCWVVVAMNNNAISGIKKVVIDSNEKQSYIDRIGQNVLDAFTTLYKANIEYSQELLTGATVVGTKTALCNSVNGALSFVKNKLGVTVETTPYDEFTYTNYINKTKTTHSFADGLLTYNVVTKGNSNASAFNVTVSVGADKTIAAMEITKNGSTGDPFAGWTYDANNLVGKSAEDIKALMGSLLNDEGKYNAGAENGTGELNTSATQSSFLVAYAALFATDNYDKAIAGAYAYTQYINDSTTYSVEGDVVTYNVVTKGNSNASSFKLTISVGADKTITAIEITKNGSTGDPFTGWTYDVSKFVGKSASDILAIISPLLKDTGKYNAGAENGTGELNTSATQSSFLVAYAALYATANYDLALIVGGAN